MNSQTTITPLRKFIPLALFTLAALPQFAAGGDDPLAWVPANAAAVGSVRLRDLKTSPITRKIFDGLDRITVKGDAARFIEESGLKPGDDLESVTLAGAPKGAAGEPATALVIFTGRFDPERLAKASVSRGAIPASEGAVTYYRITDKYQSKNGDKKAAPKNAGSHETCAVAFISGRLILAGPEASVVAALKARALNGAGFMDGVLGREFSRISAGATAWALVDVARISRHDGAAKDLHGESRGGRNESGGRPELQMLSAMKSVSVLAAQTEVGDDQVNFSITGLTADEETRGLIEDTVRGLLAAWRLAAQEKEPTLVSIIRKFEVKRNFEGVTLSGSVPGDFIEKMKQRAKAREKENKVAQRNAPAGK